MDNIGMAKSMRDRIIETERYQSGEWFFPKELQKDLDATYQQIGDVLAKMVKSNQLTSKMWKASTAYRKFSTAEKLVRGKWI